jgi:hypothetical protein
MRSFVIVGLGIALLLAVVAGGLRAEGGCKAGCESWLATCLKECADAPVVADCKANCQKVYQQCVSNCE